MSTPIDNLEVAAELSKGMHFAMVPNGIDSPEYKVSVRLSNTGETKIVFRYLKICYVNPTTNKGLTSTVLHSARGFDETDDMNVEKDKASSEFVIAPRKTEQHENSTNGWTYDILRGMAEDEKVLLLVKIIGDNSEELAVFGCRLPDLSELPYESDQKTCIAHLRRVD